MLLDSKYYSIVDKSEFKTYRNRELDWVEDTSSIETNQVVWDSTKQQAWVKKDAIQPARFLVDLGQLKVGDLVRVSCEVKNISGNTVRVGLFQYTTPTSYSNSDHWDTTLTDTWERVDTVFTVKSDLLHKMQFGLGGSNQISEYKIKNIKIEVLSKVAYDKNYRVATLRCLSGAFALHPDFVSDSCVVSNSEDTVTVTFDKPLPNRAVVIVQDSYYTVDNNYIVKSAYSTTDKVSFKIYSLTNPTTPVNISTIEDYMTIGLLMIC